MKRAVPKIAERDHRDFLAEVRQTLDKQAALILALNQAIAVLKSTAATPSIAAGTTPAAQNTVQAGPASGGNGRTGYRSLVLADLPNIGTDRVLGRNTAGAGDVEEVSLTQMLDWIGSAAQGDMLYRGASSWARLGASTAGYFLKTQGAAANPAWSGVTESFIVACSDESTALTTGTAKVTWRMPYAFTVTAVRANLATAQTSGSIFTVDINEAGTTILSTKLTVDNTEKTSTTAATPPVISDASLADDAEMTADIDQIGDGTAKGLKISLIGYRT